MPDTTLSPRLQHLLIQDHTLTGDLHLPPPVLVASEESPLYSSEPSYYPLRQKTPPLTISPLPVGKGHRPNRSIFSLLNSLIIESPPSSPGLVSPRSEPETLPSIPLERIPVPPMSAPLPSDNHPPWFKREHRPSVDITPTVHRPDIYRRHSSQPYEINPATNRIVYREFDFSPVGSRAPISRTTKACNACRSRKVRCDAGGDTGEPTTCSRCREAGVECVYSGLQKKRGPCPGGARPGMGQRQPSFKMASPPPELSPSLTSRSSYGFPPYEQDQYYHPPVTPTSSVPPPPPLSHYQQHGQPGSGWTSSHPRPLPNPNLARHPTANSNHHQHKPSVVSWHPSDIPEERSMVFERDYSMQALANEAGMRAVHGVWGNDPPTSASAFGGDGRSLPPLRVVLGHGSSYHEPRGH